MSTADDFRDRIAAASGREGLAPLVSALGFAPACDPVPPHAWAGWGLADEPDLRALVVVGRSGSLDALLAEVSGAVDAGIPRRIAGRIRARNPARLHLLLVAAAGYDTIALGTFGLDGSFHHLTVERDAIRPADLETLEEMAPSSSESGLELAIRLARALDRSRITRRFFRDFSARRDALARAWTGDDDAPPQDRSRLALLFLSRLTFLYFLQRRGALAGDDRYLARLFGRWAGERAAAPGATGGAAAPEEPSSRGTPSFYRARLVPLFFGALNRRPEHRTPAARALGPLPYLNGGLFEPHALERAHPELDLPDGEIAACFDDLLERYRFTAREAEAGAGQEVDPEILGRVFEGLMEPGRRGDTGSFYTPASAVNRVVREAVSAYLAPSCGPGEVGAVVDGRGTGVDATTRYRVRSRLERVRVLDPACGSGAFLLGALHRLALALGGLSGRPAGAIRRDIVARSLHGVDLLDDAALLASLRLWLALSVDDQEVRPLPNLDRRIRQGDALVDPLDLGAVDGADGAGRAWQPRHDPELRRLLRAVGPAARKYLESDPGEREELRRSLARAERRLAERWVASARRADDQRLRVLRARAGDRDLFGETPPEARRAAAALARGEERVRELDDVARALDETGALPFFSFGVHFADAAPGFDVIVSNPPWIRAHRWPARIRRLSARYEVCRDPAWGRAARLTGAPAGAGAQVDLSLLFLERSIRLLAPGGVLAVLVPSKVMRALYAGAARRMLLRDIEFVMVEDHGLDQRSIFRASAFAAVLVARKRARDQASTTPSRPASPGPSPPAMPAPHAQPGGAPPDPFSGDRVRIRLLRRGVAPLDLTVRQRELPLFPDDPESPWLLAPPEVAAVFRRMQAAGPPLGEHQGLRVRRGVMTGANDVLLFPVARPRLGDLVEVEAEGYERARREGRGRHRRSRFRGLVEGEGLRPVVRGAGVDAFRFEVGGRMAWCHDDRGAPGSATPRLGRYLDGHRERLERRQGWRPGLPLGAVFRLRADTLGPKVAWHDLSDTLRAVALPAAVRVDGVERELVPLNTVYFIPAPSDETAVLLAGLLNALPVTLMARSIAERAKDARFRFFAWTVSALPLPAGWRAVPATRAIAEISADAHRRGGIDPRSRRRLDRAVARLYGLDDADLEPLYAFDAWLRGDG